MVSVLLRTFPNPFARCSLGAMYIYQLIPDAETLLQLAPEELAYSLLRVANTKLQNGLVHRNEVISINPQHGHEPPYGPANVQAQVELALMEALLWLEVHALLVPAPGSNGTSGFRVIGRRGQSLLEKAHFNAYRKAAEFPKSLLHSLIADRVWIALARGDLSDAVFIAFRAVEEQVREACGYTATDIGVPLMRRAFDSTNGPLADSGQPQPEREALAHLFAGAIGSYKNPHSHRTVTITDPLEAQELVMLASHLLRIIDARRRR